jgi:hypothetical protein
MTMQARCRTRSRLAALVSGLLLFTALSTLTGCKSNDRVENELRARDIQYREALEELGKVEHHNDALQREIEALRKGAPVTPEQAAQTFGLKRIALGRGTGGLDSDGHPGDEALQIIVEPRDADEHIIKAPGVLYVLALEINQQGIKAPISAWTVPPDKLRQSWKQGLLSSGYSLILPWKNFPQTENLRVVARLATPDGRVFETDKDIRVRLVPGAPRRLEGPLDCPIPTPAFDPFALPTSQGGGASATASTASHWTPAPLDNAVGLGKPVPVMAPPLGPEN